MTKNKTIPEIPVREDWNPNEWGNIKHSTLSEQEVLYKDWEKSARAKEKNKQTYSSTIYVYSPGCDLLDFYDSEMKKLDPKSRAYSPIPPSVVYYYRFEHKYPPELFDKSYNYGRFAYLRDQLKSYYATSDKSYFSQVYYIRYKWLTKEKSQVWKFNYRKEAIKWLSERFNEKGGRFIQNKNKIEPGNATKNFIHMYWRGAKQGWIITDQMLIK